MADNLGCCIEQGCNVAPHEHSGPNRKQNRCWSEEPYKVAHFPFAGDGTSVSRRALKFFGDQLLDEYRLLFLHRDARLGSAGVHGRLPRRRHCWTG
ncbi:hypothetical protein ABIF33_006253 [Bradyrhizobium elkanii]|uniref:hypothetical protein n=1 Tax=Bradyrhizobium elkanii TaxID=29448 RepID=UPI003514121D